MALAERDFTRVKSTQSGDTSTPMQSIPSNEASSAVVPLPT